MDINSYLQEKDFNHEGIAATAISRLNENPNDSKARQVLSMQSVTDKLPVELKDLELPDPTDSPGVKLENDKSEMDKVSLDQPFEFKPEVAPVQQKDELDDYISHMEPQAKESVKKISESLLSDYEDGLINLPDKYRLSLVRQAYEGTTPSGQIGKFFKGAGGAGVGGVLSAIGSGLSTLGEGALNVITPTEDAQAYKNVASGLAEGAIQAAPILGDVLSGAENLAEEALGVDNAPERRLDHISETSRLKHLASVAQGGVDGVLGAMDTPERKVASFVGSAATIPAIGLEGAVSKPFIKLADFAYEKGAKTLAYGAKIGAKTAKAILPAAVAYELYEHGQPGWALASLIGGYGIGLRGVKHALMDRSFNKIDDYASKIIDSPGGITVARNSQRIAEEEAGKLERFAETLRKDNPEKIKYADNPDAPTDQLSSIDKQVRDVTEQAQELRQKARSLQKWVDLGKVRQYYTKAAIAGLGMSQVSGLTMSGLAAITSQPSQTEEAAKEGYNFGVALGFPASLPLYEKGRLGVNNDKLISRGKELVNPDDLEGLDPRQKNYLLAHAGFMEPLGGSVRVLSNEKFLEYLNASKADTEGKQVTAPNGFFDKQSNTMFINRDAIQSGVIGHEIGHLAENQLRDSLQGLTQDIISKINGQSTSPAYQAFAKEYEDRMRRVLPNFEKLSPDQITKEVQAELSRIVLNNTSPAEFFGGKSGKDVLFDRFKRNGDLSLKVDPVLGAPLTEGQMENIRDIFYQVGEKAQLGEKVEPQLSKEVKSEPQAGLSPEDVKALKKKGFSDEQIASISAQDIKSQTPVESSRAKSAVLTPETNKNEPQPYPQAPKPPLGGISDEGMTNVQAAKAHLAAERGKIPDEKAFNDLIDQKGFMPQADFTHYSNKPDLEELDPSYHGTGSIGAEIKRKKGFPPPSEARNGDMAYHDRTYVYLNDAGKESVVKGQHKYTGQIDTDKLYDVQADPEGLYKQGQERAVLEGHAPNDRAAAATAMEQLIKERGYEGYMSGNVAALYNKTPAQYQGESFMPPAPNAKALAEDYVKESGIGRIVPSSKATVDVDRARKIAEDFIKLPKVDKSEATRQSYQAFAKEVEAQYDHAVNSGIKFEFTNKDPYASSAEMVQDVANNNRLKVYTGGEDHPYIGSSAKDSGGLTVNEKFRAVHDLYGHASEGNQFGPIGEERAWMKHSAMFSDEARPAMTAETRGQNSFVNYGPHMFDENGYKGDKTHPNYISPRDRPFAEQKAALLPKEHNQFMPEFGGEPLPGPESEPWVHRLLALSNKEERGHLNTGEEVELDALHQRATKEFGSFDNFMRSHGGKQYNQDNLFKDAYMPGGPIESAKAMDQPIRTNVEDKFFGSIWPKLLRDSGLQVRGKGEKSINMAASRAVKDVSDFLRDNPKFADYYNKDNIETRKAMEDHFGPLTDDEFTYYKLATGFTSPNTGLLGNTGDAIKVFELFRKEGNLDKVKLGISPKGNQIISSSPISISGTARTIKARALKSLDRVIKSTGSVGEAAKFLSEPVDVSTLNSFRQEMGYVTPVGDLGAIKDIVKEATGQDELIPRMFIFGKKVGAYTLNNIGDHRFNTVDLWESRFIRSYFQGMFKNRYGWPESVDEHKLFTTFNKHFKEEFEKQTGQQLDNSALQAARWFYILDAVRQKGWLRANTNETISHYTKLQLARISGEKGGGPGNAEDIRGNEPPHETKKSQETVPSLPVP